MAQTQDVTHKWYSGGMSETATVRFNAAELALLNELAAEFGGRSTAIKQGLRLLAQERRRQLALRSFMAEWAEHSGPPDPDGVAAMRERYFADS